MGHAHDLVPNRVQRCEDLTSRNEIFCRTEELIVGCLQQQHKLHLSV